MKVKIYCCHTPAHKILFENIFKPSLPAGFQLVTHEVRLSGAGDFLSPEFLACIRRKVDLILESLEKNRGELLVWSDVDIEFYGDCVSDLAGLIGSSGHAILFQRETRDLPDINCGFFVCRAGTEVEDFFRAVVSGLEDAPDLNEQAVINRLLAAGHLKGRWGYLPFRYYARTAGWPPGRDLLLYHANETGGKDALKRKMDQFRRYQKYRQSGLVGQWLIAFEVLAERGWDGVFSAGRRRFLRLMGWNVER